MKSKRPWGLHPSGLMFAPGSRRAEKLADRIYKFYNTAPWYDYYWLIGELDDFEKRCNRQPTNQTIIKRRRKERGLPLLERVRVTKLTEEDILLLSLAGEGFKDA